MSEAAFAEAAAEGRAEEEAYVEPEIAEEGAEGQEEAAEGEEGEPQARSKDWEKIAHDKEGVAARERSRRKEAERRTRELAERVERLESTTRRPAAEQEDIQTLIAGIPDPDEDPMATIAAMAKVIRQFGEREGKEAETTAQQEAQRRTIGKLVSDMAEYEADFRADNPDYDDAQKHYKAERTAELEDAGYRGEALRKALAEDLFGIVQRAMAAGGDPAEAVYKLARRRGFKAGTAATDDKLRKIAEGQRAGTRPSGGGRSSGPLTFSYVNSLKGAARDSAFAKLREQERRTG